MVLTLQSCGKEHTVKKARKIRNKRELNDKVLWGLILLLRIAFYISLVIAMVIIYKKAGERLRDYLM